MTPVRISTTSMKERRALKRPAALACVECRRQHLKCDGKTPTCTRCSHRGLACEYTPSRRGYRDRTESSRSKRNERMHSFAPGMRSPSSSVSVAAVPASETGQNTTQPSGGYMSPSDQMNTAHGNLASIHGQSQFIIEPRLPSPVVSISDGQENEPAQTITSTCTEFTPSLPRPNTGYRIDSGNASTPRQLPSLAGHDEEHLVNLFYSHFHPTHPFLLPRSRYDPKTYPPHLKHVVELVGSQYTSSYSREAISKAAKDAIITLSEQSASAVQSLLLYAICLHALSEQTAAVPVIARASSLAIQLGMNRDDYAIVHGGGDSLLEESLRRTWWELFVVEGYFASLHRQVNFTCNTVDLTARLPCEESLYCEGLILGEPVTLDHFDARFFSEDDQIFASACYRIDAIRIMSRVLGCSKGGKNGADDIQSVDNAIAAWRLHLPPSKASAVDRVGEVDQMILQAHAFICTAMIILHFPRSELSLTLPSAADIDCATYMTLAEPTSAQHAIKAIAASKEMSDLACLPLTKHTPLFTCCLVFSCIVQLSACSAHSHDCVVQHRDRVALMTGMLRSMKRNWPIAAEILRHINKIAGKVFKPRNTPAQAMSPTTHDSGIDMSAVFNTISWFDLFSAGDGTGQVIDMQPDRAAGAGATDMWYPH